MSKQGEFIELQGHFDIFWQKILWDFFLRQALFSPIEC